MNYTDYQNLAQRRRTIYALTKNLPLAKEEIVRIIERVLLDTPSAFHSQSTRLLALFEREHEVFWEAVADILRKIVPAENFDATARRIDGFKAGAGTVLFFEDQQVVQSLQAQFPAYADNFPVWSEHSNAMHQYSLWTALTAAGVGANLQHYNPLPDEFVRTTWDIPAHWTLRAQMVFGGIGAPAGEKAFAPLQERLKVVGL